MGMREAIERLLGLLEDGCGRVIVELPTGYGKTTAGAEVYRLLNRGVVYPEERVIHVLPLRAIVEDLAKRLAEKLGEGRVAYQAGTVVQGVNKEPFFDADYTVTTLDSFVHNMFKAPVTELYTVKRHYYIPLTRVFTSGVVFDEAHLFTSKDVKMGTAFLTSVKILARMNNPLIIMSATLTSTMKGELRKRLGDAVLIRLGARGEERDTGREVVVWDEDFTGAVGDNIKYNVGTVRMGDVVGRVVEYLGGGRRVLVIIDNRGEAVRVYNELRNRGFKAGLVHSLLTRRERLDVISKLGDYDALVGTSAIEAGVDVSFDVLVTTPTSALGLVQRVGRVCRDVEKTCVGDIVLISDYGGNREGLVDYIVKKRVCWRLPFDGGDCVGYKKLLEVFGESIKPNAGYEGELEALFNLVYIPQDMLGAFLELMRYSLVREPLVEAYTRGIGEFRSAGYGDVILDSFSIEYSGLARLAGCIEGLGVFNEDGAVVINDDELVRGFAEGDYGAFVRFVRKYIIKTKKHDTKQHNNAEKHAVGPFVILKPNCLGGEP
ncbi:MAG: CRISPR-associated helicase Cas3' [Vulcanisaeta sp.]|nr:CRISPR-associated helicase Cas3' [Vulcanisaeta sp.]